MRFWIAIVVCFVTLYSDAQVAPSNSSSNLTSSDVYCSTARLDWTSGNGIARIIIASEGAPVSAVPVTDNYYVGDRDFGDGHSFGPTQYVVYNGTGSFVLLGNLKSNTTYYFEVIEYNGGGNDYAYQTIGTPTIDFTTQDLSGSFTTDDTYQCLTDNSFSHTSTVVNPTGNPVIYAWNFDDGSATDNTANPSHTFTEKGIFEVELTLSTLGCEFTYTSRDTVAPQPNASFLLDPAVANNVNPQCYNLPDGTLNRFWFDNQTVTSSFGGATSNTVYDWTFGDGTSVLQTIGDKSHSYAEAGIYTVEIIAYNTQNGTDFCLDSFELDVEVKPSPIDSSLLALDTAQCLNNNVFDFEHLTLDNTINHQWSFGDGASANGASVSHSYASTGTFSVTLSATDPLGCLAEYVQEVIVSDAPDSDFTGLASRYCLEDDTAILSGNIADGEWLGDMVDEDGKFLPVGLGPTQVGYVVSEIGCVDTTFKSTEIFSLPVFEIGNDTTICTGTSIEKVVPAEGSTIEWSTGGADTAITISQSGLYWAAKTLNGCSYSDSFEVEVIAPPQVDLGADTTLCGDGIVTIDVRASEATYVWSDNYPNSGQRQITASGLYSVSVSNKCGDANDDILLTFLPFVCDIFIPSAFSPNGDALNSVFRPSGNVEILNMSIYTLWGEQIYASGEEIVWDGYYDDEPAQSGVYLYIIEYKLPVEGEVRRKVASGEVYLIR